MTCKHEKIAAHPLPGFNWLGVCMDCHAIAIVGEDELDDFTPLPDGAASIGETLRA